MTIFSTRFKVRSYECDSYRHVNNAVYLQYLEYARMEALEEKGFTLDRLKEKQCMVVIRRIDIHYLLPLQMNELIVIKTFTSDLRISSGTFTQQIFREHDGKKAAEATVTWVFTNLKGKPIPVPAEIKSAFEKTTG